MVDISRWVWIVVVVAVALAVATADSASAAESPQPWGAHDPHELDILEPQDVIVDEVNERLFFTTFNSRLIVVTDFSGVTLEEIPVPTRSTVMTLSPDGSTIWVAAGGATSVYSIDVATLEMTERFSDSCTYSALEYDGMLISTGPCGVFVRYLTDLTTVVHSLIGGEYVVSRPYARVVGAADPVLLVVDLGLSSASAMTIDVATWTPIATIPHSQRPSSTGVAVNPDGTEALFGNSNTTIERFSLPDLVKGPDYPLPGAGGLAFASDGSLVAAGSGIVRVFAPDSTSVVRTMHVLPEMSPHIVGVAGDGTTTALISVADTDEGFVPWLNMMDVTSDPGSISGTIRHGFPELNDGRAPLGHVDLFNDSFDYLGTVDAEPDGTYSIGEVGTGTYYQVFWNGEYGDRSSDPNVLYDYFPQLYRNQHLLGRPTAVNVTSGEVSSGIDASLAPLFLDMFGNTFADDIYWMGIAGITKGCSPPLNSLYCPDQVVTRGQMAAFLARALSLPSVSGVDFVDDDDSVFESAIESLAAFGITKGCNPPINDRFCPDAPVSRGQMAAFLDRAFDLPQPGHIEFTDDDGSIFESQIERLAAAGITKGCNPPINDRYCPEASVTRGQMAAFLNRAFAYAAESATPAAAGTIRTAESGWASP